MSIVTRSAARIPSVVSAMARYDAILRCLLGLLVFAPAANASPLITEFTARDHGRLADDDSDHSDWIELYNSDSLPANPGGWSPTNNAKKEKKRAFPAATLPSCDFLVVFASVTVSVFVPADAQLACALVINAASPARDCAWNLAANNVPSSPSSSGITRLEAARVDTTDDDPASRLANLSCLVHVGLDDGAPLTGLVVSGLPDGTGARDKQFLVRGIGPGLRQFGIGDALADPVLRVLDGNGREIARNAGWSLSVETGELSSSAASVGAFPLSPDNRDAALLLRLGPGAYTLAVDSATGQSGAALTEVYELDRAGTLASLSTIATIDAAHAAFSGSFIVRGTAPKKFLVRAVGPGLAAMGVRDALPDPQLTVFNFAGATTAARNDDWARPATSDAADAPAIAAAATACGAFALPARSKDAAVVVTLAPGAYTAIVAGKNGDAGLVLLELYGVP